MPQIRDLILRIPVLYDPIVAFDDPRNKLLSFKEQISGPLCSSGLDFVLFFFFLFTSLLWFMCEQKRVEGLDRHTDKKNGMFSMFFRQ